MHSLLLLISSELSSIKKQLSNDSKFETLKAMYDVLCGKIYSSGRRVDLGKFIEEEDEDDFIASLQDISVGFDPSSITF